MSKVNLKRCKLRVRHVSKFGEDGDDFGEFLTMKNKTFKEFFDIKLSLKKNKRFITWFRTLVHELIHFAFKIARLVYDIKLSGEKEEDFIERIEDAVILNFHVLGVKKDG